MFHFIEVTLYHNTKNIALHSFGQLPQPNTPKSLIVTKVERSVLTSPLLCSDGCNTEEKNKSGGGIN